MKSAKKEKTTGQLTRFWSARLSYFGVSPLLIEIMQSFTGETGWIDRQRLKRKKLNTYSLNDQNMIIKGFEVIKPDLISWMFKGDEELSHFLITSNIGSSREDSHFYPMDKAINHFSYGEVKITRGGNLMLSDHISLQRKGGDKGAFSACQLQSKLKVAHFYNEISKAS